MLQGPLAAQARIRMAAQSPQQKGALRLRAPPTAWLPWDRTATSACGMSLSLSPQHPDP